MPPPRWGAGAGVGPVQSGGGAQRVRSPVDTDVVGANGRHAGEVKNLSFVHNSQVRAAVLERTGSLTSAKAGPWCQQRGSNSAPAPTSVPG